MKSFNFVCLTILVLSPSLLAKPSPNLLETSLLPRDLEKLHPKLMAAFGFDLQTNNNEHKHANFWECAISVACYTCTAQLLPCLQLQEAKDCINFGRCVVGHSMTECEF